MIICGDSLEVLKNLEANSVDAVVTDPPYGLSFMGKHWDYDVPQVELWREVYRVLKPGGHLLSFAGTRTQHRMAVNIEDAGFEIRDMIAWVYGSGFPKSLNIGKAVDKVIERIGMFEPFANHYETQRKVKGLTHNKICEIGGFYENHNHGGASSNWSKGANVPTKAQYLILKPLLELSDEYDDLIDRIEREREVIGTHTTDMGGLGGERLGQKGGDITKGNSPWEGWGTALKPALEPITVARKPLEGTVANNVLKYGTGGLNIDGSRVGTDELTPRNNSNTVTIYEKGFEGEPKTIEPSPLGRFPANFIHDGSDEVVELFPQANHKTGGASARSIGGSGIYSGGGAVIPEGYNDSGSAARFFYNASEQKHGIMSVCNNTNANNVESFLWSFLVTSGLIAQKSAMPTPSEQLAQNVKSAGIQCDSCVTSIAQSLALMATENMASQVIQVCTTDYKNSTPHQSLASLVELWVSTDTTPTTASLLKLFGSVLLATDENISSDTKEKAEQRSEHARFLYQAKASKSERNKGLEGFEEKDFGSDYLSDTLREGGGRRQGRQMSNHHPTVKPVKLMQYLVKLVTPKGGTVLDPFTGSGTTGIACKLEGMEFVGIEREQEYVDIANARIDAWEPEQQERLL